MYQPIATWLAAHTLYSGAPNWSVLACGLYVLIEGYLKRNPDMRANSPLEAVANVLRRVPLVSVVAGYLATPEPPKKLAETVDDVSKRAAGFVSVPALLILASLSVLTACHLSGRAQVAVATVAAVRTVDEGIDVFTVWAVQEEQNIAKAGILACDHEQHRSDYVACVHGIVDPRRAPINRTKQAIGVYKAALAGSSGDIPAAVVGVLRALGAVGIVVGQ